MLHKINFSTNWNNKLDNAYYTTLRLSGRLCVGDTVEVWHNKSFKHHALVRGKRKMTIDQINDWMAAIDTGYEREECCNILRRMYPLISHEQWQTQPIYFYLLKVDKLPVTA